MNMGNLIRTIFIFPGILAGIAWGSETASTFPLSSETVKFNLNLSEAKCLRFSVSFKGKPAILPSDLGLTVDNKNLGENITAIEQQKQNEASAVFTIRTADDLLYYFDVRTFPDGVAFRYRIPSSTPRVIRKEHTSFTFPSSTRTWYASGPFQYGWIQAYQERRTDDIEGELLAPPATFQLPDGNYAAITEANLTHFHGAVLLGSAPNKITFGYVENEGHIKTGIPTGMPPMQYAHSVIRNVKWEAAPAAKKGEIVSPWRVLMISDDLNGLVNNRIIEKVSDSPDKKLFPAGSRTTWIKPGRSVFTWLTQGGAGRLSLTTHKKYVDGASGLGLESVVVDDGWEHWARTDKDANGRDKWEMLKELVDYARKRKVDIWVWRPSSPRSGNTGDIGLEKEEERVAFMKKCAELGVKGLKIDFFHTENVYTIKLMEDILKEAAKNRLMVIFHGVNKPTGDYYTYPNLLAKEAVRGLECVGGENNWAPGPPWPYHNTVLPFTRWLAGGADYTPLNFRNSHPPSLTFAHQFASMYVLTSRMLILAADMEDMLNTPGRSFIESVPVEWDETVVLPESRIGELAALARRKGDVWYLGVLNGEKEYSFETKLPFLKKGGYEMEILADCPGERKKIQISKKTFKTGEKLTERLLSGGGLVARIIQKN